MPNRPTDRPGPSPRGIVDKELSYKIVGCFFDVYNELGYGFSESVYARALMVALQQAGLRVAREVPVVVVFRGVEVGLYRIDMLVEDRVIVEVKATERIADATRRQVRNYLSVSKLELGLILHFGPRAEYHRILRSKDADVSRSHSANSNDSDA